MEKHEYRFYIDEIQIAQIVLTEALVGNDLQLMKVCLANLHNAAFSRVECSYIP